jgi:hypothetical protein
MAEMAQDSMLLLFLWAFESWKFSIIAVVSYFGTIRSVGKDFGN